MTDLRKSQLRKFQLSPPEGVQTIEPFVFSQSIFDKVQFPTTLKVNFQLSEFPVKRKMLLIGRVVIRDASYARMSEKTFFCEKTLQKCVFDKMF